MKIPEIRMPESLPTIPGNSTTPPLAPRQAPPSRFPAQPVTRRAHQEERRPPEERKTYQDDRRKPRREAAHPQTPPRDAAFKKEPAIFIILECVFRLGSHGSRDFVAGVLTGAGSEQTHDLLPRYHLEDLYGVLRTLAPDKVNELIEHLNRKGFIETTRGMPGEDQGLLLTEEGHRLRSHLFRTLVLDSLVREEKVPRTAPESGPARRKTPRGPFKLTPAKMVEVELRNLTSYLHALRGAESSREEAARILGLGEEATNYLLRCLEAAYELKPDFDQSKGAAAFAEEAWQALEEDLAAAIGSIEERRGAIVSARLGMGRKAPASLKEIEEELYLPLERVRIMEEEGFRKLYWLGRRTRIIPLLLREKGYEPLICTDINHGFSMEDLSNKYGLTVSALCFFLVQAMRDPSRQADTSGVADFLDGNFHDPRFRPNVIWVWGEINLPQTLPQMLESLNDRNPRVRRNACAALGKMGQSDSIEPLMRRLRDEHPQVRQYAIKALGKLGSTDALEVLQQILDDGTEKDYNWKAARDAMDRINGVLDREHARGEGYEDEEEEEE